MASGQASRHLVGRVGDMPEDTMRNVVLDGEEICLVHSEDGGYHAIGDICTHEEWNLSDGELWGFDVECPAHGSRFNVLTGAVDALPATTPARVYPVILDGDDVYVEV